MAARSVKDIKELYKFRTECDPKKTTSADIFNKWAPTYESDLNLMEYRAPILAADLIASNFRGKPEEALVLDVACGPGQLPRLMMKHGFKHFMGIDGSEEMIKLAAATGNYEDLKVVLLGPNRLPAPAGTFDVVAIISGFQPNSLPFSILKDICHVTKPGGLICISKSDHTCDAKESTYALEREIKLLEEKGFWTLMESMKSDKMLKNLSMEDEEYISGTIHLLQRTERLVLQA